MFAGVLVEACRDHSSFIDHSFRKKILRDKKKQRIALLNQLKSQNGIGDEHIDQVTLLFQGKTANLFTISVCKITSLIIEIQKCGITYFNNKYR